LHLLVRVTIGLSVSEIRHHHRHRKKNRVREFARTYWFEITWLTIVVLGIFLIFERLNIRQTLIGGTRAGLATAFDGIGHLDNLVVDFLTHITLSNAVGYVLILGALVAILLRARWRLMRDPALTTLRCPRCGSDIHRVHRRTLDRLIGLYLPVRRYRCAYSECRWRGLRVGSLHGASRRTASNSQPEPGS
jgi:hypothetical protein